MTDGVDKYVTDGVDKHVTVEKAFLYMCIGLFASIDTLFSEAMVTFTLGCSLVGYSEMSVI